MKKEAKGLKKNKEGTWEGLKGEWEREKCCNHIIILKIKTQKQTVLFNWKNLNSSLALRVLKYRLCHQIAMCSSTNT